MYTVKKTIEIAGSHCLDLGYSSKCNNMHGHNWIITIWAHAEHLNEWGMVIDFTAIKEKIHSVLDHQNLNNILPFRPTAENIAKWCADQFPQVFKVEVQESEGNIAIYETL